MRKTGRQEFIRDLVLNENIGRQSIIAERLAARGLTVTQASVSRDLDELGIVKQNGFYRPGVRPVATEIRPLSLTPAGENLLVGKSVSGLASAITVRIDQANIPEIIGTVAGDDTIFIAVQNGAGPAATDRIWELFGK